WNSRRIEPNRPPRQDMQHPAQPATTSDAFQFSGTYDSNGCGRRRCAGGRNNLESTEPRAAREVAHKERTQRPHTIYRTISRVDRRTIAVTRILDMAIHIQHVYPTRDVIKLRRAGDALHRLALAAGPAVPHDDHRALCFRGSSGIVDIG